MSKVQIGARVPPRVSMFERRDGLGWYQDAMPPITGDAARIQSALLAPVTVRRGWLARLVRR